MIPAVAPLSPWRVAAVRVLPDYRLHVEFRDGVSGVVDLARLLASERAGVFAPLINPGFFAQAYVDTGVVTWPGEIDLAPDAMHRAIKASGVWTP